MSINRNKGILLVLTTAFISGVSIFINKFGIKGADPYLFTGLKNLLAAFFLFTLIFGAGQIKVLKKLSVKDWLTLFIIGLVGGSLPFLLFFKGLSLTSAAQASFIHKNMFLIVAFLAPLLLKEKLEKRFLLPALLLLSGNILLLMKTFDFSFNQGSFLILMATFFWASENIISKNALKRLSAKIVAWGRMFFGSVLIMIFLGLTGKLQLLTNLGVNQWFWIFITSVFLFAYVASWYHGLKHLPVSVAASILVLGAPITSLLSLISGEVLGAQEIQGIVLLFLGIIVLIYLTPEVLSDRSQTRRLI